MSVRTRLRGWRGTFLMVVWPSLVAVPVAAQAAVNRDPARVRLVTEDIPRFWRALDGATLLDAADRLQTIYVDSGTAGLQGFLRGRIVSGRGLAGTVASRPRFYASIRHATMAIDSAPETRTAIRASLERLAALYPDAVFPDVYFLIGRLNSGGTTGPAGLLIGAEMYARGSETPLDELNGWERAVTGSAEAVPWIVAHELIHYQQPQLQGAVTLLSQSLREGAADFVGELISGGMINRIQHEYGDAHEAALWEEFQGAMAGTELGAWLYQGDASKDRPADLGYWMGYKVAKAYYDRSADKAAAIRRILTQSDPERFLAESGYRGGAR